MIPMQSKLHYRPAGQMQTRSYVFSVCHRQFGFTMYGIFKSRCRKYMPTYSTQEDNSNDAKNHKVISARDILSPSIISYNMIDVAGVAALIIWLYNNPDVNSARSRRKFLMTLREKLATNTFRCACRIPELFRSMQGKH